MSDCWETAGKHSYKQHVGMSQQCMEMPENSGQELGELTFPLRASQSLEYSTSLMQLILKSAPLTQKEKVLAWVTGTQWPTVEWEMISSM